MKKIVFIHGAWHGSWCWYKIEKRLKDIYEPVFINLPSHHVDKRLPGEVTLDDYVNHCLGIIGDSDVSIVAHSMGGIVLSCLCEIIPDQIEKAIYLSAFAPENGKSMFDYAKIDIHSITGQNLIIDEENKTIDVKRSLIKQCFYNETKESYVNLAKKCITINPLQPMITPLTLSENYESVDKYYIKTLYDNSISYDIQEAMTNNNEFVEEYCLKTDHSSFFSKPDSLIRVINKIMRR